MVDQVKSIWALLKADRRGVTALEYGIIAGLISVVLVTGVGLFGGSLATLFATLSTSMTPP